MTNEAPEGSPGPAPKSRVPHYIGLAVIVAVIVLGVLALR